MVSSTATTPLRSFLDQCTAYLSRPGATDLSSQTFATPEKVLAVHADFRDSVRGHLRKWEEGLMRYLQDEETVLVLIPPAHVSSLVPPPLPYPFPWSRAPLLTMLVRLLPHITLCSEAENQSLTWQNSIVDSYRHFHDLVRAEYDFTTAAAIMTPSAMLTLLQSKQ